MGRKRKTIKEKVLDFLKEDEDLNEAVAAEGRKTLPTDSRQNADKGTGAGDSGDVQGEPKKTPKEDDSTNASVDDLGGKTTTNEVPKLNFKDNSEGGKVNDRLSDNKSQREPMPKLDLSHRKTIKDDIEISNEFAALLEDLGLDSDIKDKLKDIFEDSVVLTVNDILDDACDNIEEKYQEKYEQDLLELEDKADMFLSHVAEGFVKDNELEIQNNLKVEAAEKFFGSFKELVVEHGMAFSELEDEFFSVTEGKIKKQDEQITSLLEENKALKGTAELLTEENTVDKKDTKRIKRIIESYSENISDTDKEEFLGLVESVEYNKEFRRNVKKIANLFEEDSNLEFNVTLTEETNVDDEQEINEDVQRDPLMKQLSAALDTDED